MKSYITYIIIILILPICFAATPPPEPVELEFLMPSNSVFSEWNHGIDSLLLTRKILLKDQTERPLARVVNTGMAIPDYVITIYQKQDDTCFILYRSTSKPITSADANIELVSVELPIDTSVALEIHQIWLTGIKQATYPKIRPFWTDYSTSYYSAFIDGYGVISGMSDNPLKKGSVASLMYSIVGNLRYYMIYPEQRASEMEEIKSKIAEFKKIHQTPPRQP